MLRSPIVLMIRPSEGNVKPGGPLVLMTGIDYVQVLSFTFSLSTPVVQWLSYSPLDPRFAGSMDFSERKNPENEFLRKGSKAVGPMS